MPRPNKICAYELARVPLGACPAYAVSLLALVVFQGFLPALTALSTAGFLDTALLVLGGERAAAAIARPIALVTLCVAGDWFSQQAAGFLTRMVGLRLTQTLRPRALAKKARLRYAHIENPETWDLISRAADKIDDEFAQGFCGYGGVTAAIQLAISVSSVIALLFAHVWWAALCTLGFSVPLLWLARKGGKANYQATRDTQREERLKDYLISTLLSREVAEERALFGFTRAMNEKFHAAFLRAYRARFRVQAKWFARTKISGMIYGLISVLISLTLLFAAARGEISLGLFMSLCVAAFSLVQSMSWQLTNIIDTFTKKAEYVKDYAAFMALDEDEGACLPPPGAPGAFEKLELKHVRFMYPGTDRYVLDDLSLTLKKGEHAAFVGVNGAGKTTVTKLITGLYTDYEGEILINGRDIRALPSRELRAMFSLVFQDFARYPVSVKDNIAFGCEARARKIPEFASQIGLDETVAALPDGYDTLLGKLDESGRELSGGQWQRVAIARALSSAAPIRILDEPTAALDPISEAEIYRNFQAFSKGVATIFISHRLGSTRLSQRVYVLGEGRVLEEGTHEELLSAGGLYADMYEAQRSWYQ